jgi:hypothetical protein
MINTTAGAGAGAASRYGSGSGSDQKRRLLAAPAPQHCFYESDDTYQKMAQRCDKYASREAIQVECEANSTLHESNDT